MEENNKRKFVITDIKLWANRHEFCPHGVFGVDWCGDRGFGRWELVIGDDGLPHIYTECMDSQDDKAFSEAILRSILDKATIER